MTSTSRICYQAATAFCRTTGEDLPVALRKSTIIVVSEGNGRIRQFRVPGLLFIVVPLLLLVLSVTAFFLSDDYLRMKSLMPRLALLERELGLKHNQLVHLAARVDAISGKLCDLNELDHKIRVMVNLAPGEEEGEFLGMGGSPPVAGEVALALQERDVDAVRSFHRRLDHLADQTHRIRTSKTELHEFLENQKTMLASTPSIRPTRGWLSSRFGYRTSPFTGRREFHRGIDIATRKGTPIVASADGLVLSTSKDPGYGNMIVISHGFGLETTYAHLSKILIAEGRRVKRGDAIGLVGSTGRSTGNHLHYEVQLDGVNVDPLRYILD